MLVDALFNLFFMVLQVFIIPLHPLFQWVPLPSTVFQPVPGFFATSYEAVSPFLYLLNLGPVVSFFLIVLVGVIGVRLLLAIFDVVIPPLPVIGQLYSNIMSFIRGII